jgi:hypothetical protein
MRELYEERMRLERLSAAEAAGETFFTLGFDDSARAKIEYAVVDMGNWQSVMGKAQERALRSLGCRFLSRSGFNAFVDFKVALADGSHELMPTLVEALHVAYVDLTDSRFWGDGVNRAQKFEDRANEILLAHRISFELINGLMIERESQDLHVEIVAPVLRLLSGRPEWDSVEASYQKALKEISDGHPDDAVTDAATALQDTLTLLGCEGNALGPLIADARKKGLIAGHDAPVFNWVSADRSQTGDGHHKSNANTQDAWLAVHVVGALVLRLVTGGPRPS